MCGQTRRPAFPPTRGIPFLLEERAGATLRCYDSVVNMQASSCARFYLLLLILSFCSPLQAALKVSVRVQDSRGNLRDDLPADTFRVWLHNKKVEVTNVLTPSDNLILLVLLDLAGDLNRVDVARRALIEAIENLGPHPYVALLQAQDGLQVLADPTRDHEKLTEVISNLQVSRFPSLLESVERASTIADQMLRESEVRVAVLSITDGSIRQYRGDYSNPVINPSDRTDLSRRFRDRVIRERITTIVNALHKSWAPLFFLHLERRTNSLDIAYQDGLRQFAQTTGGEALFCSSVSEIPTFLKRQVDRVTHSYVLTISNPRDTRGRVPLRVEASPELNVTHRSHIEVTD